VELPETRSPNAFQQMEGIQLGISPKGEYVIEGESVGANSALLERKLIEQLKLKQDKKIPLYILGDKMAPHQSVVTAMDVARKLGMTRIKIVTELTENS